MIGQDFEKKTGGNYIWSRNRSQTAIFTMPFSVNEWVPFRDLRYESGGIFSDGAYLKGTPLTDKTKTELQRLWYLTGTNRREPRNLIGTFSINMDNIPLFSETLTEVINDIDSALFEFVKVDNVWDSAHDCPIDGGPFYLANLLRRIDSWDKELTEILSRRRPNGSYINDVSSKSKRVVMQSAVEGISIWRDSVTRHVMCTEEFRDRIVEVGCHRWSFREVDVSER